MTMLFDPDFELPESVEEAIPTACKLTLKRGIAGTKRKRYLADRAAETNNLARKPRNSVLWGQWYDMSLISITMCILCLSVICAGHSFRQEA